MPTNTQSASQVPRHGCILTAGVGAFVAWGTAPVVHASYIYSGVVSIDIPSTSDGLFLDLDTGNFGSSRDAISGWDLNIYGVGTMLLAGQGDFGFMAAGGASEALIDNLLFRAEIGSQSSFTAGPLGIETSGSAAFNFNSSQNLIGFRFRSGATGPYHYGWMRLQLSGTDFGQPKAIFEYLWHTEPETWASAGFIPAPGALALLGSVPYLLGLRRRRT